MNFLLMSYCGCYEKVRDPERSWSCIKCPSFLQFLFLCFQVSSVHLKVFVIFNKNEETLGKDRLTEEEEAFCIYSLKLCNQYGSVGNITDWGICVRC